METRWMTWMGGLVLGVSMTAAVAVMADGDPGTDDVPRMIPYQGVLEMDGAPVNAMGGDAIWVEFGLYDGPGEGAQLRYTQRRALEVFRGRFTTTIGPTGEGGEPIEEVIRAADDLYLGMTLLGNPEDPGDDVALANRQRLMATPYAMWTTSATHLTVARDLSVGGALGMGGDLSVGGDVQLNSGEIRGVSTLSADRLSSLAVNGSDLRLGLSDGREIGERGLQRALVHDVSDVLSINYDNDFEGGTTIHGDVTVTGTLNAGSLAEWPAGHYCVFQNGGGCPAGFGPERIDLDIGTHAHPICPDRDGSPNSAGDSTMADTDGAGRCYVHIKMCCR